jgi:hypothetical protein
MNFDDIDKLVDTMNAKHPDSLPELPEECRRLRQALLGRLDRNPINTQYKQHISKPHALNDHPWQALGERNYAASMALAASISNEIKLDGFAIGAPRQRSMVSLAYSIMEAPPYLWSDAMEKLADAAPLPKHVVSRNVMPYPQMFWSRETSYVMRDATGNYEGENNWLALLYAGDHMLVIGDWFNEQTKEISLVSSHLRFGDTWPHDYKDDPQVGIVLKRCAFLNSPFVSHDRQRLAHHHRRQMERSGVPPAQVEEQIHVVMLRRKAKGTAKPPQHPQPGEGVDWKHQWWVNAHYRAQWYPSEQAHKVIWIAPYIKGPEGAPVLEKIYAVVR